MLLRLFSVLKMYYPTIIFNFNFKETLIALTCLVNVLEHQGIPSGVPLQFRTIDNSRILSSPVTSLVGNTPKGFQNNDHKAAIPAPDTIPEETIPLQKSRDEQIVEENTEKWRNVQKEDDSDLHLVKKLLSEKIEREEKAWTEKVAHENELIQEQKKVAFAHENEKDAEIRKSNTLPLIQGWIKKKALSLLGYQDKYACVHNFNFYYSKSIIRKVEGSLMSDTFINIIPLACISQLTSKKPNQFQILVVDEGDVTTQRWYKFRLDNEVECSKWVSNMTSHIDHLNRFKVNASTPAKTPASKLLKGPNTPKMKSIALGRELELNATT